jgi:hypothetical protein
MVNAILSCLLADYGPAIPVVGGPMFGFRRTGNPLWSAGD